ncbi:MAG: hypothetical protein HY231_01240 [Acidobacteria bacterium]|nr:hypothetical protein [Acidobacteriota bacterium]
MRNKYSMTTLCFIVAVALMALTLPKPARADNPDEDKPIRLRAVAESAPLGSLFSLGKVALNGKASSGEQTLWGSELIYALSDNGASVDVEALASVTLKKGALVRLAKNTNANRDANLRGVLIASLVNGEVNVKLQEDASAYVQTCGRVFTSSKGAAFRVSAKDGVALVSAAYGTIEEQQPATPKKYFVRPVGLGAQTSVRARSTRQIQVQVTDENDKPVPDIPIIFALGSAGAGTLGSGSAAGATATVQTNAQGQATVQFTAGENASTTDITATVEGTRYSWTGSLSVAAAGAGFWTPLNTTLVIAGAAAGIGLGVYFGTRNNSKDPVRQNGNPNIKP